MSLESEFKINEAKVIFRIIIRVHQTFRCSTPCPTEP